MQHVDDGRLHAYLDGELAAFGAADAAEARQHLAACADCAARLEHARALRDQAHLLLGAADPPVVEVPPFAEIRRRSAVDASPARRRWHPRALAWAASLVLALGAGWFAREAISPAGSSYALMDAAEAEAPSPTGALTAPGVEANGATGAVVPAPAAISRSAAGAPAAEGRRARDRAVGDVALKEAPAIPEFEENLIIRPPPNDAPRAEPLATAPAPLALDAIVVASEGRTAPDSQAKLRGDAAPAASRMSAPAREAGDADAAAFAPLAVAWAEDFLSGALGTKPTLLRVDPRILTGEMSDGRPAWSGRQPAPVLAVLRERSGSAIESVDALATCSSNSAACSPVPGEAGVALGAPAVNGGSASVPIRVWWVAAGGTTVRTHASTLQFVRRSGGWVIDPPDLTPR